MIKRRFIGLFCAILTFSVLVTVWHGRSSANPTVNRSRNLNCQPVTVTPQDQNFANNFLNRINTNRGSVPVRTLAGAQDAADLIAQALAVDSTILQDDPVMIGDCPLLDLLPANIVDGRFPSVQLLSIGYDSANPFASADDFYSALGTNSAAFLAELEDPAQIREMGIGYAQVGEGDHFAVFVPLKSEERNGFTIPSAHYTPNELFFLNEDPLYDGCSGTPAFSNSSFGEDFSQLENRINNNLRTNEDQLNQGDPAIVQLLNEAAQYLAEDMAHDYYIPRDPFYASGQDSPFDADDFIIDRDDNGNLVGQCTIGDFVGEYFTAAGYTPPFFNRITFDNQIGTVNEVYTLLQSMAWLSDSVYEYMAVGYAKAESGSGRLVLLMAAPPEIVLPTPTPTLTPSPIPIGVLPTLISNEGAGGSAPIDCQPSNGTGGFVDVNGNPILPGDTAVTIIAGQPATIIVGNSYNPANPTLLTFYLHGDEGNYESHDSSKYVGGEVEQIVKDNGWIYVAPQAPERVVPNQPGVEIDPPWYPWYGGVRPYDLDRQEAQENMNMLKEVFSVMQSRYNVCTNMSLGSAASGGSYFYDSLFFPMNGDQFPAFVNLNCGSGGIDSVDALGPDTTTAWNTSGYYAALQAMATNPTLINRTELSYVMGETDNREILWPNIWYSISTYDTLGFNLQREVITGAGHCSYNVQGEIADYWGEKHALIATYIPPTITPTPTDTPTPTPTDTFTPTPTDTFTLTPTDTFTPTPTDTFTPTPTNTFTPTPTDTFTPVPPSPTDTPTPTDTFTPVPPSPTDTPTPTDTFTPVPPSPTDTPTPTNTFTPIPLPSTDTPTPTSPPPTFIPLTPIPSGSTSSTPLTVGINNALSTAQPPVLMLLIAFTTIALTATAILRKSNDS